MPTEDGKRREVISTDLRTNEKRKMDENVGKITRVYKTLNRKTCEFYSNKKKISLICIDVAVRSMVNALYSFVSIVIQDIRDPMVRGFLIVNHFQHAKTSSIKKKN